MNTNILMLKSENESVNQKILFNEHKINIIEGDLSISKKDYEDLKIYNNNLNDELKNIISLQTNTEFELSDIKSKNKE